MSAEPTPATDARLMSDADYKRSKADILRRYEQNKFRQRDAADLEKITARHAPKKVN